MCLFKKQHGNYKLHGAPLYQVVRKESERVLCSKDRVRFGFHSESFIMGVTL